MNNFHFFKSKGLLLALLVGVAACSGQGFDNNASGSPEDILNAEGDWKLVEEKRAPSPLQQHMDTRGKVHPGVLGESGTYTQSAGAMHVDEDIHFRVLRLERQMEGVMQDLDMIMPKITSMPDIEPRSMGTAAPAKSLKVSQAEPKAQPKTQPETQPKTSSAPAPKAISGGPLRVTGVRTGVHPGKYRFVMDVSGKPKFGYSLDNAEKLLLVELQATGWDAAMENKLGGNPLVNGYSVEKSDDKTLLVISLKAPAKVTMAQAFRPNDIHGHRVVLDIAAE